MQNKDLKIITNVYAALTVSLLMSFIPMMVTAVLATLLFTGVWIAASVLRKKSPPDSIIANHMSFIIKTIWGASFLVLVTMTIASIYVLGVYDPSAINACAQVMMNSSAAATDMAALENAMKPCMEEFMNANMTYFINGLVIGAGPVVIYMGYRLSKGLSRATKGHRIGNLKSWF